MTASHDSAARPPLTAGLKRLLAFTTTSALAAMTLVYIDAHDPKITFADAELQAGKALNRIGYTWAKVAVEDGVARIRGEAPSETERVIAYDVVRKSLRTMMGKAGVIANVTSELKLTPEALAGIARDNEQRTRMVAESEPKTPPQDFGGARAPWTPEVAAAIEAPQTAPVAGNAALPPPSPASDHAMFEQKAFEPSAGPAEKETPAAIETASLEKPAVPEASQTAPQPSAVASPPATASESAKPQPVVTIETAAVDKPADPPAAGTATVDSKSDCKAEFADALSSSKIVFASDFAVIDKQSRPLLDKLAGIAKRCSKFSLLVEGHTDGSGRKGHNNALSKKRAEAVRWALIDRGIDMDHIAAAGFGATRPLDRSGSDSAKARNRRIEFSVLEPSSRPQSAQKSAASEQR